MTYTGLDSAEFDSFGLVQNFFSFFKLYVLQMQKSQFKAFQLIYMVQSTPPFEWCDTTHS